MPRLIFLGTAAALPTINQDNTSLLLENNNQCLMVDCSGMPYRKLLKLGISINTLQHVLITHKHVDHLNGLPSLVEAMGIAGRENPLHIYALDDAMKIIVPLLDLWELRTRDYCNFPIVLHTIKGEEDELVLQNEAFTLRTTPTNHAVPSVASKFTFPTQPTLVYSSDTAPCDTLLRFAKGADYFLLENTYCNNKSELSKITGHIYSRQFAEIATAVGAKRTFMVHHSDSDDFCASASVLKEVLNDQKEQLEILVPQDLDQFEL